MLGGVKRHTLNLLAALALIGVFLIWEQDAAYDYGLGGLVALVSLASVPLFLIASIARPEKHSGIFVYLLFAAVASIPINSSLHHAKKQESIKRGDQIVAALEQYRARVGTYPAKLVDLVPTDLPKIPNTSMGFLDSTSYRYWTDETRAEFGLLFKCPFFLRTEYTSRREKWITDD